MDFAKITKWLIEQAEHGEASISISKNRKSIYLRYDPKEQLFFVSPYLGSIEESFKRHFYTEEEAIQECQKAWSWIEQYYAGERDYL